ncbi:MAG: DEAD/DEAH box helicase [Anaerolineae bacterium]|nr:DEAD/DEAH box helicase [Anaerolineae bacterium]
MKEKTISQFSKLSPLASFLPPVRAWFEETFGEPTPPQAQGWPAIQRGEHTLILAPTGSGKTLAAFLWGIDQLFRELGESEHCESRITNHESRISEVTAEGVRLVYISPLKALNNDIHRNLRVPLAGIRAKADVLDLDLPSIRVAVRSGDTPQRERQAMLREPPHILITTPESFYLLLTSPRAREMFRTVHTVIVDEIHTLAGNKRGVHLSVSLERLQRLAEQPVQRIGLSATIDPLDEAARFLGGYEWKEASGIENQALRVTDYELPAEERPSTILSPRPVTIINAAYQKALDLQVVTTVDDFRNLPGDSVWPSIIPQVLDLIRSHRTTLVFTNNRRLAERAGDYLNEQWAAEASGKATGLIKGGAVTGVGLMATGDGTHAGPVRVHHGSVSKETRLEIESQLKAGELPALVGTSSLELGIDIGSVDLIVQLQSPKSVAQGLQRVGRSGHLVGQTSIGRIFPTHHEDLVEAAAIAGGMLCGAVEPTYTPRHPLDVLAQHIVAMVSVETWDADDLFMLVRRAYAYTDLTARAFQTTLEMLAGRYPSQAYRELRARLDWDRVNNKLSALPGSRMLSLTNGGTIPNTGAFGAYLADGKTKLGELDEEFVFETRIGDTLMLGSQVWRVLDIDENRVTVAEAPGAIPRMPFWRGDYPWRPYELGQRVGAFRRTVIEKLETLRHDLGLPEETPFKEILQNASSGILNLLGSLSDISKQEQEPDAHCAAAVNSLLTWLGETHALDVRSAWHILNYLAGQLDQTGTLATDRSILVEVFDDPLGDPRMVIHSPFGGRVNGPWGLALASALRERAGIEIEVETNDDGILLRLLESDTEFPLDIVTDMGPAEARERILRELPDSAVFGARFRQNAARALLLPGVGRGKRTPFWLQRLRAKELYQVVRKFDDFPIVIETYRDCLQDVLDLPHLEIVLDGIQRGEVQVRVMELRAPSPVAESLMFNFISTRMYEWDAPKAEQQLQRLAINRDLLQDLLKDVALDELLRPEAIEAVRGQLQHTAPTSQVRTVAELAVLLQQIGDLSPSEIAQRATVDPSGWVGRLAGDGRVVGMDIPTAHKPEFRWVLAEYQADYETAFKDVQRTERILTETDQISMVESVEEACSRILNRFLSYAGPVTLNAIRARYAFPENWLQTELDRRIEAREIVHGHFTPRAEDIPAEAEFVERRALEQIHRRTMNILRQEVQPVPFTVYADFLARWQHIHPTERLSGEGALTKILQQLRAAPVVGRIWERDVFPLRLDGYDPVDLDTLSQNGDLVWVGSGGTDPRWGRVRFLFRGEGNVYLESVPEFSTDLTDEMETSSPFQSVEALNVYKFLKSEGAVFFTDIEEALELEEKVVESALIELVLAGLVTNDNLNTLRQIVQEGKSQTQEQRLVSSLEAELTQRREALGLERESQRASRKPSRARYRSAKRRVRQLLAQTPSSARWAGRWTLVHRFSVLGKTIPLAEQVAQQTRQLFARYGIVTRDCLIDEVGAWDWGLIYQQLQRMELRGEVRRGYFVQDLPGVQFALPEVVEQLRTLRDTREDAAFVVLNACDPANLYNSSRLEGLPYETILSFTRVPSTWLIQQRGLPVLIANNNGANLATVQGVDDGIRQHALSALLAHLGSFERRISIETWNGGPVLDTPGASLLEAVGAYRSYPGMVWEPYSRLPSSPARLYKSENPPVRSN